MSEIDVFISFRGTDRRSEKCRYLIECLREEIVCVTLFTSIPTVSIFSVFFLLITALTCSSVVHFFVPNFLSFVNFFLKKPLICNDCTMLFKDSVESICELPLLLLLVPQIENGKRLLKLLEERKPWYTYEPLMERVHCPWKNNAKETRCFEDNLFFEAENLCSRMEGIIKAPLCTDNVEYHSTTQSHTVSW